MTDQNSTPHRRRDKTAAWAVHAFTASGTILGLLAVLAIIEGDKIAAFMWLGLALFVDGIDGTLARKARVSEFTPDFDGATLDNIIDYFTYVIIPALMIYWFGIVPEGWETAVAAGVMAVSTYTFANTGVKTSDYYFSGFPALWNVLVLYFHVLQTNPWINLVVIVICGILTFVPWKYVHPLRVKKWRAITLPVTVIWGATSLRLILDHPDAHPVRESSPILFTLWLLATAYFVGISIWRSLQKD